MAAALRAASDDSVTASSSRLLGAAAAAPAPSNCTRVTHRTASEALVEWARSTASLSASRALGEPSPQTRMVLIEGSDGRMTGLILAAAGGPAIGDAPPIACGFAAAALVPRKTRTPLARTRRWRGAAALVAFAR